MKFLVIPGKRSPYFLVLLFLIVCVVYANHFHNSFHFDDSHTVVDNPSIRTLSNAGRFFTDAATFSVLPSNRSWRPAVSLSLAVDYRLGGGLNPVAFHVSTFAWFCLQLFLMFSLFERLFSRSGLPDAGLWALVGALLYGVHPVSAETVNYVIQRGDLYSTLGVVAGLWFYVWRPGLRKYQLYLIPVATGLLAKPPALIFPALLFVYLALFEDQTALRALRRTVPALCLSIIFSILQARMTPPSFTAGAFSTQSYLLTQPYVWLRYLGNVLLPVHLSADTDLAPLASAVQPEAVAGFLFASAMIAAAWICSQRQSLKPVGFGLWWFVLALLPTSLYPLAEVENDHRLFFPLVGLALSLVCIVARFLVRWVPKPVVAAALTIAVIACSVGTYHRNQVWRDEASLWRDVTEKSPRNGRGWMNYGLTQMSANDLMGALTSFQQALQYSPNYSFLAINLGVLYGALGQDANAEQQFQRALQLAPGDSIPYAYYARWLDSRSRLQEAESLAHTALRINASDPIAAQVLASVQGRMKLMQAAAQTQISPEGYLALSLDHYQHGRYQECIEAARKALLLNPAYAEAYNNIAAAYQSMGRWDDAIDAAQKALALKPDFPLARNNLAWSEWNKRNARR